MLQTDPDHEQVSLSRSLSGGDERDWRALCESHVQYQSPLLSVEFAQLVATVRSDVRFLTVRKSGALMAAMAIHARPFGLARPIGSPFADLAGPLLAKGYVPDLPSLLRRVGLSAYRAESVVDPWNALSGPGVTEGESAWTIALGEQTPDAYMEACRAANPKRLKNFRRLRRRLDEAHGPVAFVHGPVEPLALSNLLAWKSQQFNDSGLVDVVTATNSAEILHAVARADGPGLQGYMTALMAEGRLYAGHFGVRLGNQFHPWISAYDATLSEFGPGVLLLKEALEHMTETGLSHYCLAGGHDHYKKYFALEQQPTKRLNVPAKGMMGSLQKAGFASWNLAGARQEDSIGARLQRRLDHIATCEPGLLKRAQEVASAVVNRR